MNHQDTAQWRFSNQGWKELVVVLTVMSTWFVFAQFADATVIKLLSIPLMAATLPARNAISWAQLPLRPIGEWFTQADQLQTLTAQLLSAQARLAELEGIAEENQQLRLMLENRHLQLQERRIGQPIASYALPSVWLGTTEGVGAGSLILYKDVLLGRVSAVDGAVASISLLSQPSDFRVLVKTASGMNGVTSTRNGQLILDNLPPEAAVVAGERVVTMGQPGVEPNILVGVTTGPVQYDQGRPIVYIDQLTSFFETPLVEIILK